MGAEWKVEFVASAEKELNGLPDPVRQEAIEVVLGLADDPLPFDSLPLKGHRNLYRIRFYRKADGDHRPHPGSWSRRVQGVAVRPIAWLAA